MNYAQSKRVYDNMMSKNRRMFSSSVDEMIRGRQILPIVKGVMNESKSTTIDEQTRCWSLSISESN